MRIDLAEAASAALAVGEPGSRPAGAVVGVLTPELTAVSASGWADLPAKGIAGTAMTEGTLLDVASVTKLAVTTATAMRLVDAGVLDLDAPAAAWLTGFRGEGKESVTVADLLAHRAGLQPWWPWYCETSDREDALDRAERLPLAGAPGERRVYSDLGFQLLGRILERITGVRVDALFREQVAAPLGLPAAGFGPVDPALAATSADGDGYELRMVQTGDPYPVPFSPSDFAGWRRHRIRGEVNDGNAAHALGGVSGHAGLFASAGDLLRIGAALTDDAFISPAVRSRFFSPAHPSAPEQGLGARLLTLDETPLGPAASGGSPAGAAASGAGRIPVAAHPGFTGTFLATALDRPLVVVVAANRLHGVAGEPVSTDRIQTAATSAAIRILRRDGALPAPATDPHPKVTP